MKSIIYLSSFIIILNSCGVSFEQSANRDGRFLDSISKLVAQKLKLNQENESRQIELKKKHVYLQHLLELEEAKLYNTQHLILLKTQEKKVLYEKKQIEEVKKIKVEIIEIEKMIEG